MDEKDIKPNSHKYKERMREREIMKKEDDQELSLPKAKEKVISGSAVKKKKSGARKFLEIFFAEDLKSMGSYILEDVIAPNIKTLICNGVNDAIGMLCWGKTGYHKNTTGVRYAGGVKPRTPYNKLSEKSPSVSRRSAYEYDDLVLGNRADAEEVLSRMDEQLYSYGTVSVGDLYEFAGLTPNWTDHNYGWTDLRGADIVRDADGWRIKMPKAIPIRGN